jgi:hypothetical protein
MAVRQKEYREFSPYGFPQWLSKMGRTKGLRGTKDQLAGHLGALTHQSKRKARLEQVEPVSMMFRTDPEFATEMAVQMELTDDEIVLLLGPDATAGTIKKIRAAVEAAAAQEEAASKPRAAADEGDDDDGPAPPNPASRSRPGAPSSGDADEKPKRPTPKAGQKSLFG